MTKSNPKVSVIIVSYQVYDFLKDCLLSLKSHKHNTDFDIWVVDNNSKDNTVEKIKQEFPNANLIESPKNLGFAAANNLGIQQCNGEYIWLLNPDTIVFDNALDELVSFLDNHSEYGCCGSRLLNQDGSLQPSTFPFPTVFNETLRLFHLDKIFKRPFYQMETWSLTNPKDVHINQGASLLVRKTALDKIGLMDEQFFMYTEEVDLSYRLYQLGWKNAWIPASQIRHYGGQSTRQNKTAMFLQLYQTKVQFFRKHYGDLRTFLYKIVIFFAALTRILPLALRNTIRNKAEDSSLIRNYSKLIQTLPKI